MNNKYYSKEEIMVNPILQPTDPDTLKIAQKIVDDFEKTKKILTDPDKLKEAAQANLLGRERRETDPNRAFVKGELKTDPDDRKVMNLRHNIEIADHRTAAPSLSNRAKKQ